MRLPPAELVAPRVSAREDLAPRVRRFNPQNRFYPHTETTTLFAGDALAVINGSVRFMARPVTMDLAAARKSMERCLSRDIEILCPGHREPLTTGVQQACEEMRRRLAAGDRWPLFG